MKGNLFVLLQVKVCPVSAADVFISKIPSMCLFKVKFETQHINRFIDDIDEKVFLGIP